MILDLLQMKAVGRRRLRGGTQPGGILNYERLLQCIKGESFVTGTFGSSLGNMSISLSGPWLIRPL